jgi:hypothetical protein
VSEEGTSGVKRHFQVAAVAETEGVGVCAQSANSVANDGCEGGCEIIRTSCWRAV